MYNAINIKMRFLALILVLAASLIGFAAAEETVGQRDQYTIDMEYLSDEQALRISQRLVYINRSDDSVDSVVFYAAGNMFRRESALAYESEDLEKVFYAGYAPAGIEIGSVLFNGEAASWGMQGKDEMYIRVDCSLEPGQSGVFEFEYYLLLMECGAFMGYGETDIRLSAFYFVPGRYNKGYSEYNVNAVLSHTRWLDADPADFGITLTLPDNYTVIASGNEEVLETSGHTAKWLITAENIREMAISFSKKYRIDSKETEVGTKMRTFTNVRSDEVIKYAEEALETCEEWFGELPGGELDIVQSDYPLGTLNYPGVIWISSDLLGSENREDMKHLIRFCVAQQYFGLSAYPLPVSDAWLSDSICEYISYLILEETEGRNAFLKAINRDWVDAIQLTIPGGLTVTSDASLFEAFEYDIVVLRRGAVVMHELRNAMGRDEMITGLGRYYDMGRDGHILTELELVEAMDWATGRSWEAFLTDWVFNVGEYVNQNIEWFE